MEIGSESGATSQSEVEQLVQFITSRKHKLYINRERTRVHLPLCWHLMFVYVAEHFANKVVSYNHVFILMKHRDTTGTCPWYKLLF